MGKEKKTAMLRQGCALLLASVAISINLPYDPDVCKEPVDRWGMDMTVMILGLAVIFFIAGKKRRQKRMCLNIACCLFASGTVLGRSFMASGTCGVLFGGVPQICTTLLVTAGYYLIYRNVLLFAEWLSGWLKEQAPFLFRRELRGKVEKWLFESHPVLGIVPVIWLLGLPWLICFFPGSIEPDACVQLRMVYGLEEMTTHHPIAVAKLLEKFIKAGEIVFDSDVMGIFLYTVSQFAAQSLIIAYVIYVMGRMKAPVLLRWGTLAFYSLYPVFPMWGYTMVKDSGYYILVLLFVTAMVHILYEGEARRNWYAAGLMLAGAAGMSLYRKDGLWVVVFTLVYGIVMYKKHRKMFAGVLVLSLAAGLLVNNIYCELKDITPGSAREVLSIPLQQTARYVRDHYDEITPEELQALQAVFETDVAELGELYNPELSDPVKDEFIPYPDSDAAKAYFKVWWQQLLKHPGTYIEAFIHHTYGYFCPDKKEGWAGEDIGVFHTTTEGLDVDLGYGIENNKGRHFLEKYSKTIKQLPAVGMLYSTGLHGWILLYCILYLCERKKWKEMLVYIPGVCILLICMLSPVNACTRYILPLIALFPIHLLWAGVSSRATNKEYPE